MNLYKYISKTSDPLVTNSKGASLTLSYQHLGRMLLMMTLAIISACKTPKFGYTSNRDSLANTLPSDFYNAGNPGTPSVNEVGGADSMHASIAQLPWEQYFQDSALNNIIRKALQFNYDLQRAVNRISMAEVSLKQAKLLQLPVLGINASASSTRFSDNGLTGSTMSGNGLHHYQSFNLGGELSWEADIWGKIKNQQKLALQDYLKTQEAAQAIRTRLIADIAKGYYNLLILEKQYQIASSSLALADSTLALTRLLKTAGKANQLSIQQTAAQRASIALLLPELKDQIAAQKNALQALTGEMPGPELSHSLLDQTAALPQAIRAGTPTDLLRNRPDVLQSEWALQMAISKIGVAKANLYPSIRLTATGGVESLKSSNWFNLPASLFGMATGSILQPVFAHGTLRKAYRTAILEKEDAVLAFRSVVLKAVTEVTDALSHYHQVNQLASIATRQVDTLQAGAENASLLYKSGLANYLEVINAQNNALQAELNLASIRGRKLIAAVEIYRSLGGGRQLP